MTGTIPIKNSAWWISARKSIWKLPKQCLSLSSVRLILVLKWEGGREVFLYSPRMWWCCKIFLSNKKMWRKWELFDLIFLNLLYELSWRLQRRVQKNDITSIYAWLVSNGLKLHLYKGRLFGFCGHDLFGITKLNH